MPSQASIRLALRVLHRFEHGTRGCEDTDAMLAREVLAEVSAEQIDAATEQILDRLDIEMPKAQKAMDDLLARLRL